VTRGEHIALHEEIIAGLREHIVWLEHEQVTMDGKTTTELVADCERSIAVHEDMIEQVFICGGVEGFS
jgi:hypothetical protein